MIPLQFVIAFLIFVLVVIILYLFNTRARVRTIEKAIRVIDPQAFTSTPVRERNVSDQISHVCAVDPIVPLFSWGDTNKWTLDVEIHPKAANNTWAQGKFLVHGYDDVLWTDDPRQAAEYLYNEMVKLVEEKGDQ